LAPDERRAALVAATIPLLREHGTAVSTRQIAHAAGVAEGTIFGVFPDKTSLCRAALASALDPEPLVAEIGATAAVAGLRERLLAVAEAVWARVVANAPIMAASRAICAPEPSVDLAAAQRRVVGAIVDVIGPYHAQLRRDPRTSARLLLLLVVAAATGRFGDGGSGDGGSGDGTLADRGSGDGGLADSREVVSLLLDGLLVRPRPASPPGEPPC
jgi:AcrR family transcriptional regulator